MLKNLKVHKKNDLLVFTYQQLLCPTLLAKAVSLAHKHITDANKTLQYQCVDCWLVMCITAMLCNGTVVP